MKRHSLTSATLVLGFACLARSGWAEDPAATAPSLMTPQHKMLAEDVGDWDCKCKFWAPGAPEPFESTATDTVRMLSGGMWQFSVFRGEFGGQPYTGHGQMGYDPQKKKYVGTWIDSMSPYLNLMEGDYDAETKTMTMISKSTNPETGKPMTSRNVTQFHEDGSRTFTIYGPDDSGEEMKMMEIVYTRKEK
jgi:hypothetical protein